MQWAKEWQQGMVLVKSPLPDPVKPKAQEMAKILMASGYQADFHLVWAGGCGRLVALQTGDFPTG